MFYNPIVYGERKLVFLCIWQKMSPDHRFSTEVMENSLGMLNQHFREYNRCSAFNQVNKDNGSKATGTVTLCCSEERCKEHDESDSRRTIYKTIKQGLFNRKIDLPDNGEGMKNHIPTNWICEDKGKADAHQQISTDNCMTGYREAHERFENMWQDTKIRQSRIQGKMLTCSVAGELQEITDICTEGGIYSTSNGGSVVSERKRVTIHMYSKREKSSGVPCAKVINLPGSLDELFNIARKYSLNQIHH